MTAPHRSLSLLIALLALISATAKAGSTDPENAARAPPTPPYPRSSAIERVEFDWSTHRREAPGSDNWPMTWADDGHQYTAWRDGGGFGGDNKKGRVTLGVARIEGDAPHYSGTNVWGGFEPEHTPQFGGKSYGILSVGGTLYLWVAPQPGPHLKECRLASSTDHGATWTQADWAFRFEDGLSIPTFLNFGRDYAGARDGFVYSYFIEPQWGPKTPKDSKFGFEVHRPGRIHLSRAPKEKLLHRDAHEFFAGLDAQGQPRWSPRIADKQPAFTDANGVGWNVSVSFNAGIRRYLLATEHGTTHAGEFGLFDAPEPWGPWTTVAYDEAWGDGHIEVSAFFWSIPNKWLSTDGTRFTMVFTGKNSNDSWNTVSGNFAMPRSEAGTAVPPGGRRARSVFAVKPDLGDKVAPPNRDLSIHHVNPKLPDQYYIETEGTGGAYRGGYSRWAGLYDYFNIGVYPDAVKAEMLKRTDTCLERGHDYFFAAT